MITVFVHTDRFSEGPQYSYVASTFVLVLDWWVETESPLAPKEVDDLFRALVLPTLVTTLAA